MSTNGRSKDFPKGKREEIIDLLRQMRNGPWKDLSREEFEQEARGFLHDEGITEEKDVTEILGQIPEPDSGI